MIKEKIIKDYESYKVRSDGKVISMYRRSGRDGKGIDYKEIELKPCYNKQGYNMVNLFKDGKQKTKLVHRLVAEAFIPNPDNLPQVNHIDGNKDNNNVSNLEWCSALQNNTHAIKNGLRDPHLIGEKNGMSKITEDQAKEIINMILNGYCNAEIAYKFNLHDRYVSLIRGKKRWKHLWNTEFNYVKSIPKSDPKRTKAFNAQRLSKTH